MCSWLGLSASPTRTLDSDGVVYAAVEAACGRREGELLEPLSDSGGAEVAFGLADCELGGVDLGEERRRVPLCMLAPCPSFGDGVAGVLDAQRKAFPAPA